MKSMRHITRAAIVIALLLPLGCASDGATPLDFTAGPLPPPVERLDKEQVQAAIDRGVAFLVKSQNPDGSWGGAAVHRHGDPVCPIPAGHVALQTAVSAMCVDALVDVNVTNQAALTALDRGMIWLIANAMKADNAGSGNLDYGVWAHIYALEALIAVRNRGGLPSKHMSELDLAVRDMVRKLEWYQGENGGWGYYVEFAAARPLGAGCPFIAGPALLALKAARDVGFTVSQPVIDRAMTMLRKSRMPNYVYYYRLDAGPWHSNSQPVPSLGRSQACNAALHVWGDEDVNTQIIANVLNRLFLKGGWLDLARKQISPHTGYWEIAAYYYYYAYYYGSRCIDLLPENERPPFQAQLAHVLLPRQETDGSWWDFPLYTYHQFYGTAYALMALERAIR